MKNTNKKTKPTSGVVILRRRYVKNNPSKEQFIKDELERLDIAQQIYDLRHATGLTQADLAGLIGTSPSVISRLEDANYTGHSLTMLRRIAAALGKDIQIQFVEKQAKAI